MAWDDYSDLQKFGMGAGIGGIGAGLGSMLFGSNKNPADAGMKYLDQIPGAVGQYYDPWIQQGQQVMQHPEMAGQNINQIGSQYQQSPGFKFALQQALQGAGHAAAAGGMAGSPQHEQQNMQLATQIGNQDYYNWLNPAMEMYNQTANRGFQGSSNMADQIAQALAAKSQLGYQGQVNKNQQQGSQWGDLLGGIGTLAAFML